MNILAIHLYHFMDYARLRGITWQDMLALVKDPPTDWMDEQAVVSEADLYAVLRYIDAQLKDRAWAIRCGHFLSMKLLGLIYRISMQVTTIQEALYYLQSYLSAAVPIVEAHADISEESVAITFSIQNRDEKINRLILEYTLAIVGREVRLMAGERTAVQWYSPAYTETYPADWQQGGAFTITFPPAILKAALQSNIHLPLDLLVPEYLKMIELLKSDDSFAGRVKMTLLSMSDPQLPDIETVSGALYLTPRTLQRRLGAEGITFRELLEEVKKQLSTYLLRHDRCTVAGISTILGYAEPASFIHSFHKWFGDSPERMRRKMRV